MTDSPPDEYDVNDDLLVMCQGKPRCPYTNEQLQKIKVEKGGCVWCEKIWFDSNGEQTARCAPGEA